MEIQFDLLVIDKPTRSTGRIYPLKEVEKMIASLKRKKHPFICENSKDYDLDDSIEISLAEASHELIDLFIEDNMLKCKIKILNTPRGKNLLDAINMYPKDNLKCSPVGMGEINDNGIIKNYTLKNVIIKPNWGNNDN